MTSALSFTRPRLSLVSFDVVKTLLRPAGPGVGHQYAEAAFRLNGWRLDPSLLDTAFRNQFKAQNRLLPNYGRAQNLTGRQWWTKLVCNTIKEAAAKQDEATVTTSGRGQSPTISDVELAAVAAHLFETFDWDIYPHAVDVLSWLRQDKDIRLVVLSNSDDRLHQVLQTKDLSRYFDAILTSHEVGFSKPDPRIFDEIFRLFPGIPPSECLHVGDDVIRDWQAARDFGMSAMLVNHSPTNNDDVKTDDLENFRSCNLLQLKQKIQEHFEF